MKIDQSHLVANSDPTLAGLFHLDCSVVVLDGNRLLSRKQFAQLIEISERCFDRYRQITDPFDPRHIPPACCQQHGHSYWRLAVCLQYLQRPLL